MLLVLLLACAFAQCADAGQIRIDPLLQFRTETSDASLSPDGRTLAFNWCHPDYSCGLYLRPFFGGEVRLFARIDDKQGFPAAPRWSPNGKAIAFVRWYAHYDGRLSILSLATGRERDLGPVASGQFSWSPDGRYLAASEYVSDTEVPGPSRIVLIPVSGAEKRRTLASSGEAVAFSPSGYSIAYTDGSELKLLRLGEEYVRMGEPSVIATEQRQIDGVWWTSDGKHLLYQVWGDSQFLEEIAAGGNAQPEELPALTRSLEISQMLADGMALATQSISLTAIWRVNLTSSTPKPELVPDPSPANDPDVSPDGRQLIAIEQKRGISQIWVKDVNGLNKRLLVQSIPEFRNPDDFAFPMRVEWSPDGKWISLTARPFYGNSDVRSWLYVVSSSGGPLRRLAISEDSIIQPCWAPDSKSIYASNGSFQLVRVDLATGSVSRIASSRATQARVSPDGKFLYYFGLGPRSLRRMPLTGGTEEFMLPGDFESAVVDNSNAAIYLIQMVHDDPNPFRCNVVRFDPVRREAHIMTSIDFRPVSAIIRAGFLYLYQQDDPKRRVVLVKGL